MAYTLAISLHLQSIHLAVEMLFCPERTFDQMVFLFVCFCELSIVYDINKSLKVCGLVSVFVHSEVNLCG